MKIVFFVDRFPLVSETSILAQIGGMTEHGVNGFLVPEKSARAIADCCSLEKACMRTVDA